MSADTAERWERIDCPVCASRSFTPLFEKAGEPFVRCVECGLTLINPRPHFDRLREGYDAAYSALYMRKAEKKLIRARRRVKRIKRAYGVSGRWLDVGCSAGFVVKAAAEAGFDAYGVDIEAGAISYGREQLGLEQLHLGVLGEQHYPAGWFNVISAYDVIEHVPDLNAFLREIKRLLAHDGVCDLATPDIGHWRVPRPLERWQEFKPSEHLYYFDRGTLQRLLLNNGLTLDRVRFALKPGLKVSVRHAS